MQNPFTARRPMTQCLQRKTGRCSALSCSTLLRKDLELRCMRGPDDREVSPVRRHDRGHTQTLGGRNDGRIHRSERQVPVPVHEFGNTEPVTRSDGFDREFARRQISEESDLCFRIEMSLLPLRPALAAPSRRSGSPKWASMASRVSSEMVIPRRCASCLSTASTRSGSLTVVRRMVCQHTTEGTTERGWCTQDSHRCDRIG